MNNYIINYEIERIISNYDRNFPQFNDLHIILTREMITNVKFIILKQKILDYEKLFNFLKLTYETISGTHAKNNLIFKMTDELFFALKPYFKVEEYRSIND